MATGVGVPMVTVALMHRALGNLRADPDRAYGGVVFSARLCGFDRKKRLLGHTTTQPA